MLFIPEPSYEDYLTYKIKKGDTLLSVAQDLSIEPSFLRSYHNRFCISVKDLIGADFPYHLEYVILAPEKIELTDDEKEKDRKKVVHNNCSIILSLDSAQINNSYSVVYTIQNGGKIDTVKQQFNIKWKAKSDNNFYFFEVNRIESTYVNDSITNTMVEEIAQKASSALYPLLVVVDERGKWVYINNFSQIEERWQETKKEIRKYYKRDQVEKYFSIYDRNLENSDALYFSMSKDWFLNAFFNGIHIQFPSSLSIQTEIDFPLMAKSENLNYKVNQKVDDYLDIDNFIVIDIDGKLDDDRHKTDFERELNLPVKEYSEEKVAGNYRAKYFLNPLNHMPEAIFVSCSLELDTPQKYSVTISNLNDKKEMRTTPEIQLFVEEVKPKKKWWQF
ncbi:LysM peptidoglycan-binding domain-containing protein [Flavobacterium sp.]|uniref:LysM peptidoglycan-binding domain-containing protein n=1 Tax=Flavobacterium sp. TaxID=239 RepID=UPI003D120ACE